MQTIINLAVTYWIQALFAAMAAGMGALFRWLVKRFRENDRRQAAMENGI